MKKPKQRFRLLFAALLFTPLLGAKGCDLGVVGEDCAAGSTDPKCAAQTCGGLTAEKCDAGEYCNYPLAAKCGAADATGTCAAVPSACDLVYAPVCGCDGKTYGNECEAASKGISVAKTGECAPASGGVCGGLKGLKCPATQYCNYPADAQCGFADATGVCADKPQACDLVYAPVCGCDGKTYGNECEAASKSVSVKSKGECTSTPAECGGLTGLACAKGEYCSYAPDALCGAADATGTCAPVPQACDDIYAPVCGCDDKTYANECEAAAQGVSVAAKGECKPSTNDVACGARLGNTCKSGEYCFMTPEAMCGRADATGVCRPVPNGCTKELRPVCGCDGNTYSNPCMAAAAGVAVDYETACKSSVEKDCGGIVPLLCGAGEFCDYPVESNCGASDQTGVCRSIPEGCPADWNPVCGCDGKTYGNACTAAESGVSVQAKGECSKK